MHNYVKSSNETLRKLGYRLTPQRHMILSVIQEAGGHLSIDQITERVQERNPYVHWNYCESWDWYGKITYRANSHIMRSQKLPRIITWFAAGATLLSISKIHSWGISMKN